MGGKQVAIGIDLGTTYSCVGYWKDDRVEIVDSDYSKKTTPSCIAFTGDEERLIGDAALDQASLNTTNTIFNIKRLIGRRFSEETVQNDIKLWPFKVTAGRDDKPMISVTTDNGETKEYTPEEISSMILGKLKKLAEVHIGSEVKDAVITVPAYFDQSQRQATIDAGTKAGLNVLRLINEPTAAAIAYALDHNFSTIAGKRNVLVFNLGGGKFDVSFLTVKNDNIEVKAVGGSSHLGGEDFDTRTVEYFVEIFQMKHRKDISGDPKAMRRLRTDCEKHKRSLSTATRTKIEIPELYEGITFSEILTRSKFEELNSDLFNECIEIVEKCLIDAKMDKKDVDDVVLVGGSSRIPKIQKLLSEFLNGKKLCKRLNSDEAVAYGAAVQAAMLSGQRSEKFQNLKVVDVTPLSLGVEIRGRVMYVFIPKNTTIPTKVVKEFTTAYDYQTAITIPVYEGERVRSVDNKLLGEMRLTGIEPALRRVAKVDVCFNMQGDGILDVSARDRCTGQEISVTIKDAILSAEEIQRMIKEAGEYQTSDEMYRQKGVARYALEVFIFQLRTEMKAKSMDMEDDEKRKAEKAIKKAIKMLDSKELAEVSEYEEEIKKLMNVVPSSLLTVPSV